MMRKVALGAIAWVPFTIPALLASIGFLFVVVIGYFVIVVALERVRAKLAEPILIRPDEALGDESYRAAPLTRG